MRKAVHYITDKQGGILKVLLAFVMVLFIGVMILVYVASKRANPVFLDESGKPIGTQPAPDHPHSTQSKR